MDMLKLFHGFVKVLTLICHSCYMHLLQLQRGLSKLLQSSWLAGWWAQRLLMVGPIQGLTKTGVECMGDIP